MRSLEVIGSFAFCIQVLKCRHNGAFGTLDSGYAIPISGTQTLRRCVRVTLLYVLRRASICPCVRIHVCVRRETTALMLSVNAKVNVNSLHVVSVGEGWVVAVSTNHIAERVYNSAARNLQFVMRATCYATRTAPVAF